MLPTSSFNDINEPTVLPTDKFTDVVAFLVSSLEWPKKPGFLQESPRESEGGFDL
jgi:hypothetical protein